MQTSTQTSRRSSLVKVGGALGIAGSFVSIGAFLFALAFDAVFILAPIPILLGAIGLVVSVIGALTQHLPREEDTQPISAMFVCLTAIITGAIEMWVWMNMPS